MKKKKLSILISTLSLALTVSMSGCTVSISFENGDKKWLVTYADVALNGTKVILHDYSPEIGKELTIYCFQPHPGYCACILIPR